MSSDERMKTEGEPSPPPMGSIHIHERVYEHQKWVHELKVADAHRAHDVETEFGYKNNEARLHRVMK